MKLISTAEILNAPMTNPEIESSKSKLYSLLWAIASTTIIIIIFCKEGKSVFDWAVFNPNVLTGLLVLLLSLGCINWWVQFFDRRPVLKLNSDGIWNRKGFLLLKTIQIPWAQVNYFYILEETRKSMMEALMIGQRDIDKEIKIELSGLDKSIADILLVMKEYSVLYNFQELGKESKL
jgi:hypothetical protein